MKLTFVNGKENGVGAMVIKNPFRLGNICGQYRCKGKYAFLNYDQQEDEIVVVRQKEKWFTLLIFFHEFLHYCSRKIFKGKTRCKINDWIDRKVKRKVDRGS